MIKIFDRKDFSSVYSLIVDGIQDKKKKAFKLCGWVKLDCFHSTPPLPIVDGSLININQTKTFLILILEQIQ